MFRYKLYGLSINSSRPIELLQTVDESFPADLNVKWNISTADTPDNKFNWKTVSTELLDELRDVYIYETVLPDAYLTKIVFKVDEVRDLNFILDAGQKNLRIFHQPGELKSDLESYFVGPVLSFILRLRGVLCLHSSVVGIDGRAIAFAGHATAGKSTLAAGMADAGAEILSDDIAVLLEKNGQFYVQPGYSKVRLRPVAADFLTDNPENLPMVYSHRQSRYISLEEERKFHSSELPLAAVYILGEISDEYKTPFIKPLEIKERLINLVKNTSGSYVVRGQSRAAELRTLTRIAGRIPIRKLFYAHAIETLPQQCEVIIEDFRKLTALSKTASSLNQSL